MSSVIARENVYSDSNINKNIIDGQNSQLTKDNEKSVVLNVSCCNNIVCCNNNISQSSSCCCQKTVKCRLTDTGVDLKLVHRRTWPKVFTLFSSLFFMIQRKVENKVDSLSHFRLYRLTANFLKIFVWKFFRLLIRCFKKVDLILEKFLYSDSGLWFLAHIFNLNICNLSLLIWNIIYCKKLCLRFCTLYLIRIILYLFFSIPIFGMISCMLFLVSFFLKASSCKQFFEFLSCGLTLRKRITKLRGHNLIPILMYFCMMIYCKTYDLHIYFEHLETLCSFWYLTLLPMIAQIQIMMHHMFRLTFVRVRRQSYFTKQRLIVTYFFGKFCFVIYICIYLLSFMIILLVNIYVYIISDTRQESKLLHFLNLAIIESLQPSRNLSFSATTLRDCNFCVSDII